jgi:hypothetical protein
MSPVADVTLGRSSKHAMCNEPEGSAVDPCVYRFPPLAECRKRFDELIHGGIDWGSGKSESFDEDEWEKEPPRDR